MNRRHFVTIVTTWIAAGKGILTGFNKHTKLEMPAARGYYQEFMLRLPNNVNFRVKPTVLSDLFGPGISEGDRTLYFQTDTPLRMVMDKNGYLRIEVSE